MTNPTDLPVFTYNGIPIGGAKCSCEIELYDDGGVILSIHSFCQLHGDGVYHFPDDPSKMSTRFMVSIAKPYLMKDYFSS
jgi:hypothetical protein